MESGQQDKKEDGVRMFSEREDSNERSSIYSFVPFEHIKTLLEGHQRIINVPVGLVTPDNEILIAIGWQPICTDFHRSCANSEAECIQSNAEIQSRLFRGGTVAAKCANGLWDIAVPIMVDGRHVATLFVGQFLYDDETVDYDFFRERAAQCGFDEAAYLAALAKVPRVSKQYVDEIMAYTANLVELLAELGLKNRQLIKEIQERQSAEHALHEEERRYRALVQNVPGAVYQCLNNERYTTLFISDAIEEIIGYPAQWMTEESVSLMALIHPDDRASVSRIVDDAVARRRPYVVKYRMQCRDGGYAWVEERGQGVCDHEGNLQFLQGVIFDISQQRHIEEERRRLEEQMARSHKMESLGILAGGIAHDFNNLLVGILGHADMILNDVPPDSPTRMGMEAIMDAARRAADLTRQMLAYSGKGRFTIETLNLSKMLDSMKPLLLKSFPESQSLQFALQENLPSVRGDAALLHQMVLSLVNNAVESYGDTEGIVWIRTGTLQVDGAVLESAYLGDKVPDGGYVFLEVSDHGCGMDEETQRRLCDPFFSTKFAGRGLGMAAVLGMVRGQKAHLVLDSAPGKGTTVRVLFPEHTEMPSSDRQVPATASRGDRRILLVDDEEIVRNVAKKMLQRAGYAVLTTSNGSDALELLKQENGRIHAVILDLTMPDMSGEDTLAAIRKANGRVPVILSSGFSKEEVLARIGAWPGVTFLPKPYDVNSLDNLLSRLLS